KPNRRQALKQLSMSTIGLAIGPQLLASAHTKSTLEDPLGIALVGLGNYSRVMLGPALRATQNCRLKGVVTGDAEKGRRWADEYGFSPESVYHYDNFEDIADNPEIDIIYIVLPNFMHAEYSIRALRAGKHVICEKPMAMNAEECRQMIQASEETGKLLSVGYRLHYEKHHQKVMALAAEKPFGPINMVEASLAYHQPDPTIWRLKKDLGGGGAIMDLGVYLIQGCRYGVGEEPIALSARGYIHDQSRFTDIYETMMFQLEFPSGTIANCTTSYSSYVDQMHVGCYRGYYGLKPSFGGRGTDGYIRDEAMNLTDVNQQAEHMDDFALSIRESKAVGVPAEEGLKDMLIVDAIKRSAKQQGKRILL
ncbi:MAG: Gfo/Idh/MocA family oxidoreductase, partial [Bacteroidota bacterium]